MTTVYYIDDIGRVCEFKIEQDIVSQEPFNNEMDEQFPFGWSLDRSDLEDNESDEYNDPEAQSYDEDRGDN